MKNQQTGLIYIMGRGHSGSTLLAALLDHSDEVHNVGELNYWVESLCGCGEPLFECAFWKNIQHEFENNCQYEWSESIKLIRDQAVRMPSAIPLFLKTRSSYLQHLASVHTHILDSIAQSTSGKYILDASKQPIRSLFLMRYQPKCRFVHIVRRPEGYLSSYLHRIHHQDKVFFLGHYYKSSRWNFFLICLMALTWLIGNLLVEIVAWLDRDRVIRIRYEDLMSQPVTEIKRLENFLDINLEPLLGAIEKHEKITIGHVIGGNARIRTENEFVFEPSVGSSRSLPWYYKLLIRLCSWPLMLVYNYPLFRSTDMPYNTK